jgi:hypothetical protein
MSVETKDASLRAIGITAAIVLSGTWASLGIAWLLWHGDHADRRPLEQQQFRYGPQDEPDVLKAWPAIEARQREHLTTYGWVDRPAGVVRIPIDEAMKRLAAP